MVLFFVILALVFVLVLVIVSNIVIVPQSKVYVIERLGSYSDTWTAGLHVKIPFIERIAKKVSLKEQVADFPPQPVITRDNVTMQIDTVVFFQVMDAKLYTYGVNQPIAAIESLSATTLRNIIGEMELDHTLTSRDVINGKITAILDEATDKWGIKVNRVEVKNIIPPREIQEAMEKQMKAEREKRAVILKADGEKQAAITAAEGEKEAAILRADAVKQQRILEAEGEAQAILAVQKANADAIRLLNEAMPSDKVLAIRSLEALAKVANGKATKIIIPSELQNLGGVVPSIKELMTDPGRRVSAHLSSSKLKQLPVTLSGVTGSCSFAIYALSGGSLLPFFLVLLCLLFAAQLFDALFLALDVGPRPGEALVLLAPAGKGVEGKGQPKMYSRAYSRASSVIRASSAPITATTQPAFKKNWPFWRQYSSKFSALTALRP